MNLYVDCVLGLLLIGFHHAARRMFYRLPLYQESGFYVSNDTILNRRINPRLSPHLRFSGGGKILPEIFYSLIYLFGGGPRYAFHSRFAYTLLSTLLYPGLAIVCAQLGMGAAGIWATLFLAALVLAEPQFGSYWESSEQFELFPLVWGFALLLLGSNTGSEWLVGAGLGLWILNALFLKLSSIVIPFVFSVQVVRGGDSWITAAVPWAAGLALYALWILALGTNPIATLAGVVRRKMATGNRLFSRQGFLLLYTKFQQMLDVFGKNLPLLLFGSFGFYHALVVAPGPNFDHLSLLTMSTIIVFFIQTHPAPYHTLLIAPVLVVWAGFGAAVLSTFAFNFWTACSWGALFAYAIVFFLRPKFMKLHEFYEWIWSARPRSIAASELLRQQVLLADAPRIKSKTFDFSVFIAGPHSQLHLLLGSAYPTTIVSASPDLDETAPGWQRELVDAFRVYPPPYILDTTDSFSVAGAARWGFDYEILDENPGYWRLYGHRPAQMSYKGQEGDPRLFDFEPFLARQS